jgi:haloacetate dehalogenase
MNRLVDIGLGTKIEIEDEGYGHTVVLIHGWPITSYHWRFIKPMLHKAGYRTLAVTLRGLGGNSVGEGNLAKLTLAREVQSLLEKLDINQYSIIGHDWGGTVAYLLSHENPDKCCALVIEEEVLPGVISPIAYPGTDYYPKWHGEFNQVIGLAEELLEGKEAIYYRKFLTQSAGQNTLDERAICKYIYGYTDHDNLKLQLLNSLGYIAPKNKTLMTLDHAYLLR